MQREDFLLLLDEMFEYPAGTLKGPERLDELGNWDSMAMMSLIALADEHCRVTISPRQFVNCEKVEDLLGLAGFKA